MAYKAENYIVEIHLGMDVLHKDYGKDKGCADRAIKRIAAVALFDELRVWHGGRCIETVSRWSLPEPVQS